MTGELVQKGIGRGMVRLARIAHNADSAGEEDEEVQIAVHCRAVQVPSPHDLWPQHLLEARPGLVGEGGVRQHAHAMDHRHQAAATSHLCVPASRSTAAVSVTSASSTSILTPRLRRASIASSASASGSRRPFRTMVLAPWSASHSATAQPMPPRPPVTK